ncbi:asparaginase [uncultured Vibrio sp.]|uniref:asparaginase n=1 Tax=uncultured Vibrio sp. TaxID=114054 RepID=UPI002AA90B9A|nr:asparaginase [uncultured Vibrio sp.]
MSSLMSFSVLADSLPKVTIFGTGGTIAGSSKQATDVTGYKSGEIAVGTLIDAVPEIAKVADVSGIQVANTSSANITSDILLSMGKQANDLLKQDVSGIVVTHGTDTTEETAFFLDLVNQTEKPIIVVGAMRPATAISADGPMNLLNAVKLATSEESVGRGSMIMLNDYIGSAYYTTKTNAISLDTFKGRDEGFLGVFAGGVPHFYYEPSKVTGKHTFNMSQVDKLPKVDILYSYQDMTTEQFDALIKSGSEGIVIAGSGNGSTPKAVKDKVKNLKEKGYPVVLSTRTGGGYVTHKDHAIGSGLLNPQKARILLMLALTETKDVNKIEKIFGTEA